MSVAEQLIGGDAPNAGTLSPELFVINRDSDMTPEQQPLPSRYPDLKFEIAKEDMLGNGVYEPNIDSQTRSVMKALRDAGVEELEPGRRWDLGHEDIAPTYPERKKHLDRIKAYFSTEVSVHDPSDKYNGQATIRRKRNEVVDHKEALGTVMSQLAEVNHPVYQVLTYVRDNYGAKVEEGARVDDFALAENVVKLTLWNALRDVYNDQVTAAKEPEPLPDEEAEVSSLDNPEHIQ